MPGWHHLPKIEAEKCGGASLGPGWRQGGTTPENWWPKAQKTGIDGRAAPGNQEPWRSSSEEPSSVPAETGAKRIWESAKSTAAGIK